MFQFLHKNDNKKKKKTIEMKLDKERVCTLVCVFVLCAFLHELPRSVLTEFTIFHREKDGLDFTERMNKLTVALWPCRYLHCTSI